VLLNPCTIIEVLTPATTAFQLGRKFAGYRASLSIREVMFVYPSAHRVELYTRRADGLWELRDHDYSDAVPLATPSHPLPLSRIFPSAPSAA
jgi:Uma2 family endonuclease